MICVFFSTLAASHLSMLIVLLAILPLFSHKDEIFSLHAVRILGPCKVVFKYWEKVLSDEMDRKDVAQLLWWDSDEAEVPGTPPE